jgi:hypothetical protein
VIAEASDRRVLGALRFVDAVTGIRLLEPFRVSAAGVRGIRNLSGLFVITSTPALHPQTLSLDVPAFDPGERQPVEFTITDPAGRFLARRATVLLPRDPDPAHAGDPGSLYQPVEVRMFPSPTAATAAQWAVVRASVRGEGAGTVRGGALVVAVRVGDGETVGRGLSDPRGEALVAVPGIPITTWAEGNDAVLATEVEVDLRVVWDPAAEGVPPDPDDLEARAGTLTVGTTRVTLASGRVLTKPL